MRIVLNCLVIVLLFVLPSYAQNPRRPSLKGLEGVFVQISLWNEQDKVLLDDSALGELLMQAQLKLRQNGIKVQNKLDAISGRPVLMIEFGFYDIPKSNPEFVGSYAVHVLCQLEQNVHLDRSQRPGRAVTWASGPTIGVTNSGVIREHSKRLVAELLDIFVNDFLADPPDDSLIGLSGRC
jgi:hypothetical protein